MARHSLTLILPALLLPALLSAAESDYPSGMLRRFSSARVRAPLTDRSAARGFLQAHFESAPAGYEWREADATADRNYVHHRYQLFFQGRRVVDGILKLHYNRDGWVQYASSTWDLPVVPTLPGRTEERRAAIEGQIGRQFSARYSVAPTRIQMEPVIWLDHQNKKAVPAFEVILTGERQGVFRKFLVDEQSGNLLEEKRWLRFASSNVYLTNPTDSLTMETLPTNDVAGQLHNSFVHVFFEENLSNPTPMEVNPADYSGSISPAPSAFEYQCNGSAVQCPNIGFDTVNVYYHLSTYRAALDTYYNKLGINHKFDADPLPVIVNSLTPALNSSDGPGQDVNNAAFVPSGCRPKSNIEKCLIFLRPATVTNNICGPNQVQFFDLAREGLIVVHEFQHYVTDSVAHLIPGSTGANVGDAIHEGYSDYFAASQISSVAGHDVPVVGAYAAQQCPAFQRDVSVLKVFDDSDNATSDPHVAGLTWASGLWHLRVQLGQTAADELAYESQFFLPSLPGFVDVVEALVQADEALNQGAHVATIRDLFYNQLHFVGGQTGVFRDPNNEIAEVGFSSCAGVASSGRLARSPHLSQAPSAPPLSALTLLVLLAWLGVTVRIGRNYFRETV